MQGGESGRIIIVDDDASAVRILSAILREEGYETLPAASTVMAGTILKNEDVDAVITDLKVPAIDGIQLLDTVQRDSPEVAVIFLTSYGSQDSAAWALSLGAYYYFLKPPDYSLLKGILARAVEHKRILRELDQLKRQQAWEETCRRIFPAAGESAGLRRALENCRAMDGGVLLCGEPGVGRKRLARALHLWEAGAAKPFVTFEGRTRWQPAVRSGQKETDRGEPEWRSLLELATGGTLFLDGVEYLDRQSQASLAELLEEEGKCCDSQRRRCFRLLASTSADLDESAAAEQFDPKLLQAVGRFRFNIPPLRERRFDIPILAYAFLQEIAARQDRHLLISPAAIHLLQDYSWPGNIGQFKAELERAAAQADDGVIREEHLSIRPTGRPAANEPRTLKEMEANAILQALERSKGNKSRTARMLGLSRKTLYKRLKELPIN